MTIDAAAREPPKTVLLERRGGIAGLHVHAQHDYAALAPAQRRAVDALLAHPPAAAGAGAPDRFRYRVSVTHANGEQRVVDVDEDALPPALEPLVRPGIHDTP